MTQNALGIDMGEILGRVSSLKTAQQNREQSSTKYEHYKHDRALKEARVSKEKAAVSEEYGKRGINPDLPPEALNIISKYDEQEKAAAIKINDEIGSVLVRVTEADNPKEAYTQGYDLLMKKYGADALRNIPPDYSKDRVNTFLAQSISMKDALAGRESRLKVKQKETAEETKYTREQKGKTDLEKLKHKNRMALESIKKTKTTKTKLQKLFDLKKQYKKQGETKEDIATIDKAIKLASEGRESEAEKMLAAMMKLENGEKSSTKTKPRTTKDFENLMLQED